MMKKPRDTRYVLVNLKKHENVRVYVQICLAASRTAFRSLEYLSAWSREGI